MRAIVTGGLGFIGSHLVDALVKAGDDVMVIDDGRTAAITVSESAAPVITCNMVYAQMESADMIWHLASPIGSARMQPGVLSKIVREAGAVIAGAQYSGARLVAFSSCEVYGSHKDVVHESSTMRVTPPFTSRTEYQLGKAAMECMMMNAGIPVQIVRPENVVGSRQQGTGGFVMARFREQLQQGVPLTVFRPGTQKRAFMHVSDVIAFCMLLRSRKRVWKQSRIWNIAAPLNAISMKALACKLSRGVNVVDGRVVLGAHYQDVPEKVLDVTAAQDIGWTAKVTLKEIIEEVLRDQCVHAGS